MTVDIEATFRHAVPLFALAEVEFLPDRLEAWEVVKPDNKWLQKRLPAILDAAETAGLIYLGWTWEPRYGRPVSASDIQVFNNRTV